MPTKRGSIFLFRFAGIRVYLHWSWFLLAFYGIQARRVNYSSYLWPVLEYLSLFAIVTMHEFGHSLACKQVGGKADQIVLWPFGGVAYVSPPRRPGATLWCIAAGPLVNVALFPVFSVAVLLARGAGWPDSAGNAYNFLVALWTIDLVLLLFNLLPIYPLDGGQIFQSLLWFAFGYTRSLMIATVVGLVGLAGLIILAVYVGSWWLCIMGVFAASNCWAGLQLARAVARQEAAPKHPGLACPACGQPPPMGPFWACGKCGQRYDVFAAQSVCPNCGAQVAAAPCLSCGTLVRMDAFQKPG